VTALAVVALVATVLGAVVLGWLFVVAIVAAILWLTLYFARVV
jgi:hypothetical protein